MENENKYDNEYTYESESYEEEKDNNKKRKTIGIIILAILLILILLLLLRGCFGKKEESRSNTLLEAGKEYFNYNTDELPLGKGLCSEVTLSELVSLGLLDPDEYSDCDSDATLVKVCRLESLKYHYVPIMSCDTENSEDEYGEFVEGTEADLIEDESDVKFSYQIEYLDLSGSNLGDAETYWYEDIPYENYKTLKVVKYYSYQDKQYIWNIKTPFYYPDDKTNSNNVKEYYTSIPSADYSNKTAKNDEVSKWYKATVVSKENATSDSIKTYYLRNGAPAYSATAPEGFELTNNGYNEGGLTVASQSRTYTKTSDGATTHTAIKYYQCASSSKSNLYNNSLTACETNTNGYTVFVRNYYTCGAAEDPEVASGTTCATTCPTGTTKNYDGTSCGTYGSWQYNSTACEGDSSVCNNLPAPITLYKWYRYENRSYYPSGSKTADGENTYYLTSPASGYIQDATTITTGWKWYKNVDSITGNYYTFSPQTGATKTSTFRYTEWTEYSTNAVKAVSGSREVRTKLKYTIQEILETTEEGTWKVVNEEYTEDKQALVDAIIALGYDVTSFEDILEFNDLKYSIKLYYRNKEEK